MQVSVGPDMMRDMKRILVVIVSLAAIGMLVWRYRLKKREASYQLALNSYAETLRPGTTRKGVEDYLRARKIEFGQMCCIDHKNSPKHSWDDLVKIGEEGAPWFCTRHSVYIGFEFEDRGQHVVWEAND